MENTCNDECFLWKKYKEHCPNYIESWWKPNEDESRPILIKDCAPKRIFLMIQDLHNRLVGVEQSQEQQRNQFDNFVSTIKFIESRRDVIAIPSKKREGL